MSEHEPTPLHRSDTGEADCPDSTRSTGDARRETPGPFPRYGDGYKNRSRQDSGRKLVAIVIPTHTVDITPDQQISLNHLHRFLGKYDKYLVIPAHQSGRLPGLLVKQFDSRFFSSRDTYNKLLLSEEFYRSFQDYRFILIYQLDCLVFSDELADWCSRGYDHIGAPWFKRPGLPYEYEGPESCGNGGFCLRNVDRCIEAITNSNGARRVFPRKSEIGERGLFGALHRNARLNLNSASRFRHNEDGWWSFHAKNYLSDFRIPPTDVGVKFSFEFDPRFCFERNHRQLPFGCHAWNIYDRAFWEPHLIVDVATGGANDDARHGNLSSGSRTVARHASSNVEK